MHYWTRNNFLPQWVVVCVVVVFLSAASCAEIPVGKSSFVFDNGRENSIAVFAYRPAAHDRTDPVLVVMHGAKRNAAAYREPWIEQAERVGLMLILPEFPKEGYPNTDYQRVGVFDEAGSLRPPGERTPELIEELFDYVVERNNLSTTQYSLYGHSAGGQFVHRMMLLKPSARVALALPANAGWYTLPTLSKAYPEGLEGSGVAEESLAAALSNEVVVLLGDGDTDSGHSLLPRQEAAIRQGPHRLARGQFFYQQLQYTADSLNCPLNWKKVEISGVAHSNAGMAKHAADLIREHVGRD